MKKYIVIDTYEGGTLMKQSTIKEILNQYSHELEEHMEDAKARVRHGISTGNKTTASTALNKAFAVQGMQEATAVLTERILNAEDKPESYILKITAVVDDFDKTHNNYQVEVKANDCDAGTVMAVYEDITERIVHLLENAGIPKALVVDRMIHACWNGLNSSEEAQP